MHRKNASYSGKTYRTNASFADSFIELAAPQLSGAALRNHPIRPRTSLGAGRVADTSKRRELPAACQEPLPARATSAFPTSSLITYLHNREEGTRVDLGRSQTFLADAARDFSAALSSFSHFKATTGKESMN
jgi:hypothetical protein